MAFGAFASSLLSRAGPFLSKYVPRVSRALSPFGAQPVRTLVRSPAAQRFLAQAGRVGGGAARIAAGGVVFGAGEQAVRGFFGGEEEGERRRYRRINPLNAQAARRAIRRIKSVRKMLHKIESQMPKRSCTRPHMRRRKC